MERANNNLCWTERLGKQTENFVSSLSKLSIKKLKLEYRLKPFTLHFISYIKTFNAKNVNLLNILPIVLFNGMLDLLLRKIFDENNIDFVIFRDHVTSTLLKFNFTSDIMYGLIEKWAHI